MKECERYIELANLCVDGLLTEEENEALRAHIGHCADCRRRAEAAGALQGAMAGLEAAPDTLAPGIRYKLELEPSEKKRWRRFMPGAVTFAAACAALVILFSQQDAGSPAFTGFVSKPSVQDRADSGAAYGIAPEATAMPQASAKENMEFFASAASGTDADSAADQTRGSDDTDEKGLAPAAQPSPPAANAGGLGGDGNASEPVSDEAALANVPEDLRAVGIVLADGEVPQELKQYEIVEKGGFLYVLMPAEDYEAYAASNGRVLQGAESVLDAEAERGVVVFSK